jgi:hypothetical protein
LALDHRTTVGAPIDEAIDLPVLVAAEDDRCIADIARPEVPYLRYFGLEPDKAPGRPAEDLLQFELVN